MDEILRRIEGALYIVLALQVIQLFNWLAWVTGNKETVVARLLPKINDFAKRGVYELSVQLEKRKRAKVPDGMSAIPVIDDVQFRQFCRALLKRVKDRRAAGGSIEDVKVTEAEWVGNGFTRDQFIAFRAQLERRGIIRVVDGRGTRGWQFDRKGSYDSAYNRLEKLANEILI